MTPPTADSSPLLLFVYGTLRTDGARGDLLRPWTLRAEPAETAGRLFALPEGYPALLAEGGGGGRVPGELLTLRPETPLAEIDAYEGEDYRRERADVFPAAGGRVRAWRYAWRPERREALLARGVEIAGGARRGP